MKSRNALGQATNLTRYDGAGRLREAVDPNGVTTVHAYDARGRLGSVTTAGATTAFGYDAAGHLTRVTLADGSFAAYTDDGAGRLIEVADAAGNRIVYTLDAAGHAVGETWRNPDGSVARRRTRQFDALGRLHTRIGAAGQTTQYAYDAQGNPTGITDPKAQPTGQAYDARHRLTQVTDALAGLTALSYDRQDRVTGLTAPNGAATVYTYDGLGNLTQEQSPDRGTTGATHDAAGNVLTRTDARGVSVTATYDALNRPLTETWSSGETVAYTYDAAPGCSLGSGRLCQVQDSAGQTTYAYDAQGRVIRETRTEAGVTLVTDYTLDGAGRLLATALPSGERLSLTRDAAGRVTALASATETLAQGIGYDAAGALTGQTLSNGVTETTTYDADGQRTAQTHSGGSGSADNGGDDIPTLGEWGALLLGGVLLIILARRSRGSSLAGWLLPVLAGMLGLLPDARASDASYTYDSNGNVLTRSAPDLGTTTFSYDALDRLTREQGPVITQSFGYDANGNRTGDRAGSYAYAPASNRQTSRPQGPVTLDGAGHTTAQGGFTYTWDGAGRLKTVRLSATLLATYHYDARHRRTRKETTAAAPQGAATVLYTYDQNDHLLAETDSSGPIRSYLWRDDTPVAQIEHRPSRRVLYLETDHLNTPRAARNEQGTLVWRWEADAFGSSPPDEDPDGDGQPTTVNLRYPGQVFDPESGLHYNQARYYDPSTGRYLSPDPIGLAGGVNTYAYVGSNPLAFVDPMGLAACFVDFPDYPITIPGTKIQTTLTPGHAGVFGYNESTGQTRYYEYGRYDSDFGSVERRPLPNLVIQPDGTPAPESWKKLIDALNKIGKDTEAELSCDKSADETKVYEYSERVKNDTNRPRYSWNPFRSNTCRDFARRAFEAGGGN
ncbi:MAG: RHS repeat-associated core domain-containing protein [Pseudomonadota bacterium]